MMVPFSPPPLQKVKLLKSTQEKIDVMHQKFEIPQDVTIRALNETCDVKTDKGLKEGEFSSQSF